MSANDIRIETTLEKPKGRSASAGDYIDDRMAGSYYAGSMMRNGGHGGYAPDHHGSRTIGTMTGDRGVHVETTQRGAYEASFGGSQNPQRGRQRRIGATLTRSEGNLDRVGLSSPPPAYIDLNNTQSYHAANSGSYSYATMPHSTVLSPGPASAPYNTQPRSMDHNAGYIEPLPLDDGTYQGEIRLGTFRPPVSPAYQQQVQETRYQEHQEYSSQNYSNDGQLFTSIH